MAVVAVIIVVVGAVLIFSNSDTAEPAQEQMPQQQTLAGSEQQAETSSEADQTFEIDLQNFSFSPTKLTAKAGETVTINLTNNGGTHDFVIDELDVQSSTTSGGDTTSVTFTVPEDASGQTYAYYCSIGNHRAQGMEGQLEIN